MACNTPLTSIVNLCSGNNVGGLINIYIAPAEFVSATTTNASGVITGITMSGSATFTKFEFNKNSANYTEVASISLENGSTFYTTTLTLKIAKRDSTKRASIALLTSGQRNLYTVITDANGSLWFQGYTNYANVTGNGGGSGAAKADGSSYELTILSEEPDMMPGVTQAALTAVI